MHPVLAAVAALPALLALCSRAEGLRVLMVATVSSKSHYIWSNSLAEGLLENGHHVVELSNRRPDLPHPNRTTFAIGEFISEVVDFGELEDFKGGVKPWEKMNRLLEFATDSFDWTFKSKAFEKIVSYLKSRNDRFDVMIIDFCFQEPLIGLAGLVGRPPIVALTAYLHPVQMSSLLGSPLTPSIVPHEASLYQPNMNFFERLGNTLYYFMYWYGYHIPIDQSSEDYYRKYFGDAATPFAELTQDIALALVNTHPVINGPRPLVPSIIEVGLMHARPGTPVKNKNLRAWLDGATEGFIYMSLGSFAKSSRMKLEKRRSLLKVFAGLKQRVLWKYESDDILSELPENVRTEAWLPQNDILAHPKIRAFISHCGGLSTQELAYHGVPVLGLPLFADQHANGMRSELLGLGRIVSFDDFSEQLFEEGLQDVINNPMYRENARRISAVLRDQKETPLQRAVWWVEHVARTGGAPHLRSPARGLHWAQLYLLDVLALLLAALAAPLLLLRLGLRLRRSGGPRAKTD